MIAIVFDPDPDVLARLVESVALHWEAVEQYTAQRAHLTAWGYPKLADAVGADPDEEREHLDRLLARLEWFDAAAEIGPEPAEPAAWPRHDLDGILAANLALETRAAAVERAGYAAAVAAGDPGTADVFLANLKGSEAGILTVRATRRRVADQTLANLLSAYNG